MNKPRAVAALILSAAALTACGTDAINLAPAAQTIPLDAPVASAGPIATSAPTVTANPRPTTTQAPAPVVTRKPRPVKPTLTVIVDMPVVTANPRPVQPTPTVMTEAPAPIVTANPRPTVDEPVVVETGSAAMPVEGVPSVVISAAPVIERGNVTAKPTPIVVQPCSEEDPESCE